MMPMTGWMTTLPSLMRQRQGSMHVGPDLALHGIGKAGHEHQEQDDPDAHLLALHHFRVGCPGQEGDDVEGFLVQVSEVPSVYSTVPSCNGCGMAI